MRPITVVPKAAPKVTCCAVVKDVFADQLEAAKMDAVGAPPAVDAKSMADRD